MIGVVRHSQKNNQRIVKMVISYVFCSIQPMYFRLRLPNLLDPFHAYQRNSSCIPLARSCRKDIVIHDSFPSKHNKVSPGYCMIKNKKPISIADLSLARASLLYLLKLYPSAHKKIVNFHSVNSCRHDYFLQK